MSAETKIKCDECGIQKGETNGWSSSVYLDTPMFMTYHAADEDYEHSAYPQTRKDYCGRECAQTALERWLSTGSIAKTTASPEPQANDGGSVPEGVSNV